MPGNADVIIIGAGAAGLAAARQLVAAGLEPLVLEAAGRPGGRVHTTYPAGPDLPVELGAEFLHGEAPVTRRLLDAFGIRYLRGAEDSVAASAGRIQPADDYFDDISDLVGRIVDRGADESFAAFLSRHRAHPAAERARRFVQGFHAADPDRISAHSLAGGAESVRAVERSARIVGGHALLTNALATELAGTIRYRTPALAVEWQRGACRVRTRNGSLHARAAIITVPIGVIQSGALPVLPMPPVAAAALDHLASGDVVRITFVCRDRFWCSGKLAGAHTAFIHTPDSPFNIWWTQEPLQVPMLVAWAGGPAARSLRTLTPAQRAARALHDLAAALGMRSADVAARAVYWAEHDWTADPLALGAYSYPLVGGSAAASRLARLHDGTLAFAGEATSSQNGTVEGALQSGERAARRIARALSGR